ncbi:hypothetical protein [Kordiimonas sp.]|uniref:hypothetical protein n=1 Tax=Kordiimonas sp. TaxID=1970157 RepID=UPI003A8EAD57
MIDNAATALPVGDLTSQLFSGGVDTAFSFVAGDLAMPVQLMECKEKPDSAGPDSTRTPFLLVFRADVDEGHLMQQAVEFHGSIQGLEDGSVDGLLIHRMLRPMNMPEGAYYQVIFN